jgi:hypothetical protein
MSIFNTDNIKTNGLTSNGDITVTGNTYVSGSTISNGDVKGFSLVSTQSINDEGGEIRLTTPQTNTTLSGGSVTLDIFQNKLRFFETGGSNRGAYIDFTSASTGVGSNLLSGGVKVIPIATSNTAIGTGSNDYYLNFKVPYNLTISKVDFSVSVAGSDSVRIGIYRGQDLTAVLVGQSAGGTVSTLNSVSIVAEVGQNLSFSAGEWMVIGVAVGGTTTNLFGMSCPVNNLIAWTNTTDSTGGFPTNPRIKAGTRTSFPSIEINIV